MENLSERINSLSVSATISMAKKAREYKDKGVDVINLSLGEPDFKTPEHICTAAKEAIDSQNYFGYPPVAGYPELRTAIADKLQKENGLPWKSDNVVVSTGAKQSIANVMLSLVNPGDEVIIFNPYWVTYSEIAKLAGGVPIFVKGKLENDYKPTSEQVEEMISSKTKLAIFSSPCNPTGSVYTHEEYGQLADLFSNYPEIMVVADEIYEHIIFEGEHKSIGSYKGMEENTITVNGFSKAFAMTGWRIGYIGAPLWVSRACEKMQGQFTSGPNTIAQRAALHAISSDLGPTKEMAKEYEHRRNIIYDRIAEIPGVKNYKPKGAFYFFPDFSYYFGRSFQGKVINNASDLCMYLLEHGHVSAVTGEAFGEPNNIRLSYAASEEELIEAINRIKNSLQNLT